MALDQDKLRAMTFGISYSVDANLDFDEVFPDGWAGEDYPTAADVVAALQESRSKMSALRDWDLLPDDGTDIEVWASDPGRSSASW